MVQRAEWRKLPGDPDTPLGWWRRRLRTTFAIVLGVSIAVILLYGIAWQCGFVALAMFLGPPGGILATYLALKKAKQNSLPRLAALAPSPAPAECFPVEFAISHRDVCTGSDQGIASFVDGWLHVEGLRTSFSLRPVDISKPRPLPDRDALDIPGGQQVELRSLGPTQEDRDTFRETLRVWYRFPFGLPSGEPLLPPLAVHPSAATGPLNTLLTHAVFTVPVVALAIFFGYWRATAHLLPLVAPYVVFAYRNAGKAWADLRSLKNLHRRALDEGKIAELIAHSSS
jgi:hypothetical protein